MTSHRVPGAGCRVRKIAGGRARASMPRAAGADAARRRVPRAQRAARSGSHRRHRGRPDQSRPARGQRRGEPACPSAALRVAGAPRRPAPGRAGGGRAPRSQGPDDVRGTPAGRCALPRRLDARRGRRRLHVPQLPRPGVPVAAQGRLRPARVGRRRGRAHGRLSPQGALRLVPGEPRDGHRPRGYAGRSARACRRRALPLRPHAVR